MSSFAEPTEHAEREAGPTGTPLPAPARGASGRAWTTFAGIMLALAGGMNIIDGLWALDASNSPAISEEAEELLLYTNSLETWGWTYTVIGIGLVVLGIGVLSRNPVARWFGVGAASFSMLSNMVWAFVYPMPALIHFTVASLVLFALVAYGDKEPDRGPAPVPA